VIAVSRRPLDAQDETPRAALAPLRLAVVCDFPEEGWPSMDLAAEMLLRGVESGHREAVRAGRVCPPFRRRLGLLPGLGRTRLAVNADRLLNRFWDYPRHLRRRVGEFDAFHVCDHSYAQLVHSLPADRTGVYCHDLDTFRCLLEPRRERRPRWFRALARSTLKGLQKAAVVFFSTREVGEQLRRFEVADPARLVQAPLGVCPEFKPAPDEDEPHPSPPVEGRPFLLHVGSCIPRKRIDVLLDVFAEVRRRRPGLTLVQVGGEWTPGQREQLARLGIEAAVMQLRGLERSRLAEFYRRAALVLQPSEAEGFGLPVVEALACGAAVIASDLPVLREVGGDAALFRPVADVAAWADAVCRVLEDADAAPPRRVRLEQAQRYSWAAHARTIVIAYRRLLGLVESSPGRTAAPCASFT
jgi:glycosyltransferase involved in cell wall biosynthesis